MPTRNFEDKFLAKLSKIDKRDIESFLAHLVGEKNFLEVIFSSIVWLPSGSCFSETFSQAKAGSGLFT